MTNTNINPYVKVSRWYAGLECGLRIVNSMAPHQQDLLQSDQGAARTLAAIHHGASSHLTKTVVRLKNNWRCYRV